MGDSRPIVRPASAISGPPVSGPTHSSQGEANKCPASTQIVGAGRFAFCNHPSSPTRYEM